MYWKWKEVVFSKKGPRTKKKYHHIFKNPKKAFIKALHLTKHTMAAILNGALARAGHKCGCNIIVKYEHYRISFSKHNGGLFS